MTAPDHTVAIVVVAKRRREETRHRAADALRRLDAASLPVSFAAVARAAGISRAWLYREPDLRSEIETLRRTQTAASSRAVPSRERAASESLRSQLDALRALEADLLAENKQLREALARKLGAERRGVMADGDW
jgi:hypothetical protein